jgi:hypothetical protein
MRGYEIYFEYEGGKRTSFVHVLSHRARVVALARNVHPLIAAGIMTPSIPVVI